MISSIEHLYTFNIGLLRVDGPHVVTYYLVLSRIIIVLLGMTIIRVFHFKLDCYN